MDIAGALSALNATVELMKNAIGARDANKLTEAHSAFRQKYIEIQNQCFALTETCRTLAEEKASETQRAMQLEREIARLRCHAADIAENYERWTFSFGSTVFRSKPGVTLNGGTEYLCANCVERGQKTYLQPRSHARELHCPEGHGQLRI